MRTAGGSDVEVPVLSDKKLVVNRPRATFAKRWLWIVPGIVENGLTTNGEASRPTQVDATAMPSDSQAASIIFCVSAAAGAQTLRCIAFELILEPQPAPRHPLRFGRAAGGSRRH